METEKSKIVSLGGNLDQSLERGYRLDLRALFAEAWRQTLRGGFGLFFGIVVVLCLWLLCHELVLARLGEQSALFMLVVGSMFIVALMAPFTGALDMMGLQRAVGLRVRAVMIFDYLRQFLPLATASLTINLFSAGLAPLVARLGLPEFVGVIPSALLGVAMMFTVPLILERGMAPMTAIITSWRLFVKAWPQLLLLHVVVGILFFLAMLPMGIGMVWMAPFYFVIKGLIYREVCGIRVQVDPEAAARTADNSGSFAA